MYQFVYVSSAVNLFSDSQLADLLDASRRRNASCGVTGLLVYLNGNFIQLLEGAREDVAATRVRIETDPRHRGMITLLEGDCDGRDFENWSMAFEKLDDPTAAELPGYSDFLRRDTDESAHHSAALRLLQFFRELGH
jgi:hypothetical protein